MSLNQLIDDGGSIQSWKDLACDNLRLNNLQLSEPSVTDINALFVNGANNVNVVCQLVNLGVMACLKIPRVMLTGDGVALDVTASGVIPSGSLPANTTSILARYNDCSGSTVRDPITVNTAGDVSFQSIAGAGIFDSLVTNVVWWFTV